MFPLCSDWKQKSLAHCSRQGLSHSSLWRISKWLSLAWSIVDWRYVLTIRRAEKHLSLEALVAWETRIQHKRFYYFRELLPRATAGLPSQSLPQLSSLEDSCSWNEISRARAVNIEVAVQDVLITAAWQQLIHHHNKLLQSPWVELLPVCCRFGNKADQRVETHWVVVSSALTHHTRSCCSLKLSVYPMLLYPQVI